MAHVSHAMSDFAMIFRPEYCEAALAGFHESSNHAQQCALAGTVVAHDYIEATGRETGRDAADGGEAAKEFTRLSRIRTGEDETSLVPVMLCVSVALASGPELLTRRARLPR